MVIEGVFTLSAPIGDIFDFLLKPETILTCLPGAESVELKDDSTYECVVKQKVGPIKVKMKLLNQLTKVDRPNRIELEGRGLEMSKLGHLKQTAVVDLKEVSPGQVAVSYESHVDLVGKLAMFGDRIMRAKAKEVEKQFTKNLEERLRLQFA
jgi:uncharacterized protein